MRDDDPAYQNWLQSIPGEISRDTLWRLPAYRLGLYVASDAPLDAERIEKERRLQSVADQLLRAVRSIPANIAEGYGRSTGRERARFYEFALGSAREASDWYFIARLALPADTLSRRLAVLERIRRILAAVIPRERELRLRPSRGSR